MSFPTWTRTIAALVSLAALQTGCCHLCPPEPYNPARNLIVEDAHGRGLDRIEVGETLNVGLRGLEPERSYRVELLDHRGRVVSFYQLTTDRLGAIPPAPVWYHSGVIGCGRLEAERESVNPYRFRTFEEARKVLAGRVFTLTLRDQQGAVLAHQRLPVAQEDGTRPRIYFSNSDGCLVNSFIEGGDSAVYLTGQNLPPGADLQIFLVPNQYGWRRSARLNDVRPRYRNQAQTVTLRQGETDFTELLWIAEELDRGAYDAVLRINREERAHQLLDDDLVTYVQDTGMIVQLLSYDPPWAPGDFDIAGRLDKNWGYPYFEFHDTFEVGEEMWGAVDPAIVPATHPGGDYAAYYVIDHGSASSGLTDKSGTPEVMPVKGSCVNGSMIPIWSNPTKGEYDIVVDFGSTSASTPGGWVSDGTFDAGKDFVDRATRVGAYVVPDPAVNGTTYTTTAYSYQPATTSPSDPLRTDISSYFNSPSPAVTENMNNVPLRAEGYYPNGSGPFPLVLIVHGNHGPTYPSHTGYGYLCSLLASHGIICMSVDENFLNGSVSGEMDARAIVLLRHLQRWRQWNATPGHTFHNKVDMTKIGLAGHSRGGEAITVAHLFNTSLHNASDPDHNFNFDLEALFAIAPVDGQIGTSYSGTPIVPNGADFFIMHGSHDGDVFTFGGQKTYDRAFPTAATAAGSKGLVFVQRANHNYWNTNWAGHSNDATSITSPSSQLSAADQQAIGKVYVSGFFQFSLLGEEAYEALLTGDVTFSSIPTGTELVHQYSSKSRIDLNNYEEDHASTTGSYTGVTNMASGVSPLLDQDITGGFSSSGGACVVTSPYYFWHQTSGLVAGWSSTSATYDVNLPATIGTLVDTYPYLALRVGQIYEDPASSNTAGVDQDLSIELQLGTTTAHSLKVSNFDSLPYPLKTVIYLGWCTTANKNRDVTKSIPKTVRIPLRSFIVNRGDWQLSNVSRIRLKFDRPGTGLVVIDDIQLSK
ncbi:MAG TPA: hypothetical protein PKJ99_09635 [Thermoanaerobaculales bacterium]|nr:hypothetical protein [Thermoanaerobaculales bacterium]HQP34065.1 hypothetical protein [Polyangiaceae bacterium]